MGRNWSSFPLPSQLREFVCLFVGPSGVRVFLLAAGRIEGCQEGLIVVFLWPHILRYHHQIFCTSTTLPIRGGGGSNLKTLKMDDVLENMGVGPLSRKVELWKLIYSFLYVSLRHLQGCTTLYNHIQGCTTMYKVVQPHTRLYNLVLCLSLIHISEPTRPY